MKNASQVRSLSVVSTEARNSVPQVCCLFGDSALMIAYYSPSVSVSCVTPSSPSLSPLRIRISARKPLLGSIDKDKTPLSSSSTNANARPTTSGSSSVFPKASGSSAPISLNIGKTEDVERPFRCSQSGCLKSYRVKSRLNYHLKFGCAFNAQRFHDDAMSTPDRTPEHTLVLRHNCPIEGCQKSYKNSRDLKYHLNKGKCGLEIKRQRENSKSSLLIGLDEGLPRPARSTFIEEPLRVCAGRTVDRYLTFDKLRHGIYASWETLRSSDTMRKSREQQGDSPASSQNNGDFSPANFQVGIEGGKHGCASKPVSMPSSPQSLSDSGAPSLPEFHFAGEYTTVCDPRILCSKGKRNYELHRSALAVCRGLAEMNLGHFSIKSTNVDEESTHMLCEYDCASTLLPTPPIPPPPPPPSVRSESLKESSPPYSSQSPQPQPVIKPGLTHSKRSMDTLRTKFLSIPPGRWNLSNPVCVDSSTLVTLLPSKVALPCSVPSCPIHFPVMLVEPVLTPASKQDPAFSPCPVQQSIPTSSKWPLSGLHPNLPAPFSSSLPVREITPELRPRSGTTPVSALPPLPAIKNGGKGKIEVCVDIDRSHPVEGVVGLRVTVLVDHPVPFLVPVLLSSACAPTLTKAARATLTKEQRDAIAMPPPPLPLKDAPRHSPATSLFSKFQSDPSYFRPCLPSASLDAPFNSPSDFIEPTYNNARMPPPISPPISGAALVRENSDTEKALYGSWNGKNGVGEQKSFASFTSNPSGITSLVLFDTKVKRDMDTRF
ncbi:hypothetical protein DFH11DRAFT_366912 [Phellopilus nigrolimitatus]|nr:hypothetical protein DFH11DRAFT_366912 [Phellopilus nigrolimitatus]